MIKKCSKILIAILFVFLISLITTNTVNAKEMTLAELTEAVKEYNPKATYVYVIGDYAFTSGRLLTTQDVMLAARSIEVTDTTGKTDKDAIYGEMTIAYFKGTFDSNYKLTGLEYSENIVGTTDPKSTYDINFIDYNRFIATIDLKAIAEEAYNKYADKLATSVATEKVNNDITNTKSTIRDLSVLPKDEIKALANEIFAAEGVKSITITLTPVDGTLYEKEITSADVETILNMSKEDFSTKTGIDFEKMVGGKITAKVNLEEGYKAKDDVDTFTSEISAEVDVKAIVDTAYSKYLDNKDKLSSYVSIEREDAVNFYTMLKTVIIDIDSVPADKIKELAKEYSDKFFSVPGIKSVTVTLTALDGTTYEKEITQDDIEALNNMTNDELKTLVKEYVKTSGITVDSVIGGVISAKVNLKDGYTAKDNIDTFNTKVEAEIDFKTLANAAYNKYDADYASKLSDYVVAKKADDTANEDAIKLEVTTKVLIPDTSLIPEEEVNKIKDKINELKTEYKDEIEEIKDLLDKVTYVPGFESVTLTITTAEGEVITKTITEEQVLALKDKTTDELKELAKEYATTSDITLDSIIGGEVAVKINLKDGYIAKDGADTFKALFKAEIDFKGIANAAYDKYETNYASKLSDYVATKKVDDTTLEITAKVLTTDTSLIPEDKLNELKDEYKDEINEVKELLNKVTYIPGFKSLTITLTTSEGNTVTETITEEQVLALKDKSVDELKALVKEYVAASNLTIESVIGGEATAKINLKAGYSAKDGVDTFKVIFKAEYNLEAVTDAAYDKFNSEYAMFLTSFATVEKVSSTEYNLTVKTTDETALTQLATQLKAQAGDIFDKVSSVPGVDTITIKLTTSDNRTLSKDVTIDNVKTLYNMNIEEAKVVLKELAKKHNLDVNSILGGSVEAKINLKKGFSATNGVDTFKVNFLASEYNVIFDVDGAKTVETVKVGDTVVRPADPTKEGYTFDKWLLNGSEYDFITPVNAPITLKASWKANTYEVKFESNDTNYGTVSKTTLTVEHGTEITVDGNKITIGEETITADPKANDAQYKYSFVDWSDVPTTVTGNATIKANFVQEESKYTVTVVSADTTMGTVDVSEVADVKYGTSIETDGNVLKIADKIITAEAKTADAQYTYLFDSWTVSSSTVTSDLTITANFKKEVNKYMVSFSYNDETFGKVDKTQIEIPYGAEIKVDGNKITIGTETITATPAANTEDYKYSFKEWTNIPASNKITEGTVIYANFNQTEINKYTVTFVPSDSTAGKVEGALSITDIEEGTAISIDGNKLTINGETVTATANTKDAQYTYSFVDWTAPEAVTDDIEIKANFKKELNNYTVTFKSNDNTYGTVSPISVTVPYGSTASVSGNTITIGGKTITATPTTKTKTNYYTLEDLSSTAAIAGDTEITVNFKKWTIVDVEGNVSSAVTADYQYNKLKGAPLVSSSQYTHSMNFSGPIDNTITLKYSGTKSSQWFAIYNLSPTAVESFDTLDLMEKLTAGYDNIYESVIWDYKGWKTKNDNTNEYEYFDISKLDYDNMNYLGFSSKNWSCTIFARFMSNLCGLSGGSNFENIDTDTIVTNTTATPIKMTVKLKDGYITADGETEVTYNVVFAK